jgi:serine/threonine-protein kinase
MTTGLSAGLFVANRYCLDHQVAEGGMSEVWAATNVVTARPVALKFLKQRAGSASARYLRFIEEARATIEHRHVVRVYDVLCLDGDMPCIVMELLRGVTLRDEIRHKGRLSLDAACGLLCPVISALGCAHARGVIHCDLKPENIFLSTEEDGEMVVKVLDFGLAMHAVVGVDDNGIPIGRPRRRLHATFGTVGYAAPEQAGGGEMDHRADIWALGVVLYECLTGTRPFPRDHWDRYLASCAGGRGEVGSVLSAEWPEMPAEIPALVGRMLSPDAPSRPRLHEVQSVLQRYTDSRCLPFGEPLSIQPSDACQAPVSTDSDSDPARSYGAAEMRNPALQTEITEDASRDDPDGIRPSPRKEQRGRASVVGAIGAVAVFGAAVISLVMTGVPKTPLRSDVRPPAEEELIPPATSERFDDFGNCTAKCGCAASVVYNFGAVSSFRSYLPMTVTICSILLDCSSFYIDDPGAGRLNFDRQLGGNLEDVAFRVDDMARDVRIERQIETITSDTDYRVTLNVLSTAGLRAHQGTPEVKLDRHLWRSGMCPRPLKINVPIELRQQ